MASKAQRKIPEKERLEQPAIAALTAGAAYHEAGDIASAECHYLQALSLEPDLADALQLLGVVRHQQTRDIEALDLLGRAKSLAPRNPNIRINIGSVFNAMGRRLDAIEEFRAALSIEPKNAEVWCNLGIALRALNNISEAVEAFERAIAFAPCFPSPRKELASLYLAVKDYVNCEKAYRGYIALVPNDAAAMSNLGYLLQCQGRLDEAEDFFVRAIELASNTPELRHNLRTLLAQQGRGEEALAGFRVLLKEKPELWTAELGVAVNLLAHGAIDEGMAAIDELLNSFPDDAVVWNDTALVLLNLGKMAKAAALFQHATEIDPNMSLAYNNLGVAYLRLFQADLAIAPLREAIRLNPHSIDSHLNLARAYRTLTDLDRASLFVRAALDLPDYQQQFFVTPTQTFRATCDFDSLDRVGDVWQNCEQIPPRNLPSIFLDLLVFARSREEVLAFVALVRRWSEFINKQADITPLSVPVPRRHAANEKLRIGFLSADLRTHSVSRFLVPLMKQYDRSRFSFHCYTPIRAVGDPLQVLIGDNVDTFAILENKTCYEFAKTIRDDGIDILFELNGFTEGSKLEVVDWRPAPVQISWLGYPFTCGLKGLDHVILDRFVAPSEAGFLTEEPIIMPEAWVCFGEFTDIPISPGLPLDRNDAVTFGTLNNPYKYTREMIALWANVMKSVPGSRFLIVRPEVSSLTLVRNIAREFERNGISPDRLFFFDNRRERKNHLTYYNEIDISLDTFPLTGGTTTCEATWMGVPVVSLVGESFHQRISYSALMHCGLGDLCAFNPEDYVAKAIMLAHDPARIRAYRHGLRDVVRASPLCDEPRFLHQFQEMLEQVAKHHGLR